MVERRVDPEKEHFLVRCPFSLFCVHMSIYLSMYIQTTRPLLASPAPSNTKPPTPPQSQQIIATDGLWEFVSDADAVRIAARAKDPQQAVDALIREANRRWLQEEEVGLIWDGVVCVLGGGWVGGGLVVGVVVSRRWHHPHGTNTRTHPKRTGD